jgi:hypothetical protein
MHYGTGSGTGFGYGSHLKFYKNERPTFWEIMVPVTMKRQDFCENFLLLKNC